MSNTHARLAALVPGLAVALAAVMWPAAAHAQNDPCFQVRAAYWAAVAKAGMTAEIAVISGGYGTDAALRAALDVEKAAMVLADCEARQSAAVPTAPIGGGETGGGGGIWMTDGFLGGLFDGPIGWASFPPGSSGSVITIICGGGTYFAAYVTSVYDAIEGADLLCRTQ